MSNMLLVDCCCDSDITLELHESSTDGRVKFRGKLQEAEAENKNKRVYPYGVLDENVKRLQPIIEDRRLVGELDHPTDSLKFLMSLNQCLFELY